jgi:hypothetical protein
VLVMVDEAVFDVEAIVVFKIGSGRDVVIGCTAIEMDSSFMSVVRGAMGLR